MLEIKSEILRGMKRRQFVRHAAAWTALTAVTTTVRGAESPKRWTAAVIGATGAGDYGHGHELIFNRPDMDVVGIADPHPEGRAKAAERCQARRQYADYREMLKQERPQLVSVAPRWTDRHHAMGLAALQSGAHLYIEKPFTETLAQADELLQVARSKKLQIVVAHQMRLAPSMQYLSRALRDGLIGDLLQVLAHGKQDRRAGGEDMVVLGSHLFDLMRFFAGDALSCQARIRRQGREAQRTDIAQATEKIGPILGDEIEASFHFERGVEGRFTSRANYRETAGPWGMELRGSKGVLKILTEISPTVYSLKAGSWSANGRTDQWVPLPDDPSRNIPAQQRGFAEANQRLVDDWLEAIEKNRPPVCGGLEAMKSLEMIMAVYASGLSGAEVKLPLPDRRHPLGQF